MRNESTANSQPAPGGTAFWWRLSDNFFRRFVWFVLPVIVLALMGFSQARSAPDIYRSTASLSASSNPLVPEQQISGISVSNWESPAASTSRIINERLRTDNFLLTIADRAGLGDYVESGALSLGVLRTRIWTTEGGSSILNVNAQWGDPQTSYELAASTIDAYQGFLEETVASDSTEAAEFYSAQLAGFENERDLAQETLRSFVAQLPDDGEPPSILAQVEIDRLTQAVNAAEARMIEAQQNIDAAQLARAQLTSEAGRSFTVIDAPRVPRAPESTLLDRLITVATFIVLGLVIAGAALIVTTVLDRSVSAPNDLLAIEGVGLVATAPPVAALRSRERRRLRLRIRPIRRAAI